MSPEVEGAIEDGELSKDQILDLLSDDSDEKDDDEKLELKEDDEEDESDKEKEEDEKDDDKEEKKELKLKDDEDEEDDEEIVTHLHRKEILKAFPKLFDKYPQLEKSWYKEQEYTELFSTLGDAKEVLEKAETLDDYEKSLMEGDTESILQAVKDSDDKDTWNKVVDDYLPTLAKVDEKAYFHVLGEVIKNTIISMSGEAKKTDNKQLQAAAQLVNQFVFGTSEFQPTEKLSKTNDTGNDKLEAEREEFMQERFETARDELDTKIQNVLKSNVTEYIDPKDAMSSYVKKQAIREVMEDIQERISQDASFAKVLDKLWITSRDNKFSPVTTKKIRSVYLSKAQTLLPSVIKRIRIEALKDSGKRTTDSRSKSPERTRVRSSHKGSDNDGKGMSTIDFFNQD